MLFICFDLLRSDIIEELSWQHGLNDFYMPYKIQQSRSLVEKVSRLWYPFTDGADVCADGIAREASQGFLDKTHSKRASGS